MMPSQLKETTMQVSNRKLVSINIVKGKKEVKYTDSLFEKLMGKKAEFRYKFIQENANFIKQIDI